MSSIVINGGRVIDPATNLDEIADLYICDGVIAKIGSAEAIKAAAPPEVTTLDARGMVVTPGLVDIHVHLRDPGKTDAETVATGSAAAVAGGFTTIVGMPNTTPAIDSASAVRYVCEEGEKAALANVYTTGAISAGRRGEKLAEMAQMAEAGAVAFTDDGAAVPNPQLLRRAMEYAKMLGVPIMEHCEDASLSAGGVMNEGAVSTELGLPGWSGTAENVCILRDIELARQTGAHLHIQHVTTARGVELIGRAKEDGLSVTAEVCPHHLVLTDEAVRGYDSRFKVNPPLRTAADVAACIEGLRSGIIDILATDHAPHLHEEKERGFSEAPFGMLGLETAVGVLLTHLVHTEKISLPRLIEALTLKPASIIGLACGRLSEGAVGDIAVLDLETEWQVDSANFYSKSINTPFAGANLKGGVRATLVAGRVVYEKAM